MRQYREYAEWQRGQRHQHGRGRRAEPTGGTSLTARANSRSRMITGTRTATPGPTRYTRHHRGRRHVRTASALATATRTTMFTVMLSAFYVLAHKLTGNTDLAIRAFTAGRSDPQFHNTMGLFLNCVPFRTDIADCTSFRDIIVATKETFIDALTYELPVNVIEQTFPDFVKSREDLRTSQFIISAMPSAARRRSSPSPSRRAPVEATVRCWRRAAPRHPQRLGVESVSAATASYPAACCSTSTNSTRAPCGLGRRPAADPDQRRPRP